MLNGYSGRILHVDLTLGKLEVEKPDPAFYRKYLGGSALGAYYVLQNNPVGIDPFDPQNTLVFALSCMTGTPISGQSRMTVVAKSPLTHCIGDGQSGGFFPAEMKFAGYDAVVFAGKSDRPVYLWLHNGEAELRFAEHLWGKTTGDVEAMIRDELGDDKVEVAQCGPAGEKLVRFAGVINMSNRANGRTGMGAVMGSKNLKAVAVRGDQRPSIADIERLLQLSKWGADHFPDSDIYGLGELGTAGIIDSQNAAGGLPSYNWQSGTFEGWKSLDGKTMGRTILKERDSCYSCTVRCKRVIEAEMEAFTIDPLYGGPEYETIAIMGSSCGIDDLGAVSYANQLCNVYGMDTISCGATIAWVMECFELGILSAEDTGGLELRFGDSEAMIKAVQMIARREGFGDVLAEGSARAAMKLGKGSEEVTATVKMQELPAHMPQIKRSLALIYVVNPFGADHMSHEHDPSYSSYPERMDQIGLRDPQPDDVLNKAKVRYALTTQFLYSCLDSLNLCQFVYGPSWQLYSPNQIVEAVQAVTGWDVTIEELLEVGERRLNMLRAYNARDGIGRSEDMLPKKLTVGLRGGKSDGLYVTKEEVEQAKDWYYEMAGWDVETGMPSPDKLEKLGLEWAMD
jgi:aldehyde:ferredoxin oxidoreductase